jgi:exodeoxyribonuclease-5
MACQYFVNGNWVTEEQFKEILNNGLLDNLIADSTVKLKNFKIDQSKVLSRETRKERRNTIPAAKLAKILAKEIKSRPGYAPNLLSALELTEDGQNFKIPLWASPYAAKFESLLTSLVTNKVIKQKFAGGSYVLGSEEGFRIKEGDAAAGELKNSGVVFTKNFDPKEGLQPLRVDPETGKMLPAQIMLPFKFRDESGKILPLEDFLVKQEGSGRYMLDTSKFPEKLLQLFGFRIPTQERNSMAAVEVVGFLPEASGDLMLAPRDFTKQMGSDFDVDKLYTYMYNHFYDNKTGKLHTNFVSNAKKIENFIKITKNAIEDIKSQFKFSKAERAIIDDYIKEVTVSLTDQDYADRRAKGEEIESQLSEAANRILNSSLNAELIKELNYNLDRLSILNRSYRAHRQNNILDVHLDIMTSNNPDVIASIIALDSFGEFEGLAADISKIRKAQGLISDPVTILSDSYQRDKFINGTAGKNGVGSFSLDSTFNAIAQGKDLIYINMNDDLYQKIINNNANPTEVLLANNNPVTTFGDILSKGDLSNEYTLKSQQVIIKAKAEKRDLTKKEKESLKFKSSIIRALQSTSVDNGKAEILDKININDDTLDAIRALAQLGFEEKDIVGLISQEIVWEYVSNLKEAGSSLTGYTPDMEQKVYDKLVEKYDKQERYSKLTPAQIEQFSSGSSEKLLENIANKKLQETAKETVTSDFNIEQLALLDKFRYLTEVGKDIKKTQSGINAFSKGLPKSLIEVQSKLKQISNLNISKIFNAGKLLGEINTEGILVSPSTLNGFASYYGTRFAGKIFDNYFPYSSQGFKSVAQEVQQHMPQGANMSVTRQAELQQEIFGNIKSFLYANSDTNLFGKDPDSERRRLFVDSKDNMSLATILSKLSSQEWFQKNSFLNKLSFDLNKNGKISRIMFESATGENFDERDIYGGFNYLLSKNFPIKNPSSPDGTFNSIEYTSRMLAQELVAAAYLEGGTQGAAQYLKYVPIAYLKSLGFGEYLANSPFDFANTFFGNLSPGGPIYTMPSAFTRQYFQNNPSAAKTISMSDIEETSDKLEDRFKLTKDATKNNFVDIIDPATGDPTKTQTKFISIYAPKEVSKYVLYEFDEVAREYKKIPVLSDKYDFVAYNSERRFSTPIESGEIVTTTPPQLNLPGYGISNIPVEPSKEFNINVVNNPTKQDTGNSLAISKDLSGTKEAVDDLFNALETAEGVSKLNAQLMVLLRTLQLPEGFKVEYAKKGKTIKGGYNYKTNTLTINTDIFNELSTDEIATTINHELIHAVTGKAIKLYEAGEFDKLTDKQIEVIQRLQEVQKQYIDHLISTEGEEGLQTFAKAYAEFKQFGKKGNWTNEELSKYYGAIKLSEFVTMALTDSKFQEHLNQIPGDNNRTLWEQIKDLLASLVNALGLDIKPGSALVVAIKDSLDLINVNQEIFKDQRVTNQPTQVSTANTLSENIKNFVDTIIPNWINNKNNELQLATEFKNNQLLGQEESNIEERIWVGKEAEKLIKQGLKGEDIFEGTTFEEQIPNLLYAVISGKLAKDGISETDMYSNIFKVATQPTEVKEVLDAKYELFPGVYANAGQREAIDLLDNFLQSDKQAFLLQGKGGTGKTTIIKKVLDSVREKESVLAIAPSHKAKKVLDKSINSDKKKKPVNTITLASALAIKLDESTGKFEPDIFARQKGRVPIKKASIILIDESSMVSDNLLQEIKQMMSPNAKIIFMGDRAQLPPVGQETDSKVFDIKTGYTLTEKMRQAATSPIINIGTKVSENVESGNPVIEPIAPSDRVNSTDPISGSSIKWESSVNNALQEFVEDFRKADGDVNFAKIITFNNQNHPNPQSVKNLNEKVRARLYGENAATNQFLPGEMLTSYNSYSKDPQNPEVPPEFNNSEDLIVINSTLRKSTPITITVQSQEKGRRSKQFVFDVENLTLKNEDGKTLDNITVIANSSKEAFKAAVSELYKTDRQMAYRLSAEFADIEYGYAITSHKAQGSTYTNVYVMEDNIMGPSNGGSTKAKNQSLYVAVSRPTTKLVMVSEKNSAQSQDFDAEGFYTGDTKENMSLQDWEDYNSINDLFDESITESLISRDKYENYLLICGK